MTTSPGSGIGAGVVFAAAACGQPGGNYEITIDPLATVACAPMITAQTITITGAMCCSCGAGQTATGQHADWCAITAAARRTARGGGIDPEWQPFPTRPAFIPMSTAISDTDIDRIARRVVELLDAKKQVAER